MGAKQSCMRHVLVVSGLEMGINIGQNDCLRAACSVAGAVLLVHDRDTLPFPEDHGIILNPGVYNVVNLRLIQIHRMAPPYGHCVPQDVGASERDVFVERFNSTYTRMVSYRS
jgi:hypothetical protein